MEVPFPVEPGKDPRNHMKSQRQAHGMGLYLYRREKMPGELEILSSAMAARSQTIHLSNTPRMTALLRPA